LVLEQNFEHLDELNEINTFNPILPQLGTNFRDPFKKKRGTCDRNGIGLGVIRKDHIFRFGCWFMFSVRLDAAILVLKRAFLPAICTDMKIYLLELTGIFPVVPFRFEWWRECLLICPITNLLTVVGTCMRHSRLFSYVPIWEHWDNV
jgi:hypothetical protein